MNPIRVLVIGAGYFSSFHVQAWQALGVQVVGVVDTHAERAQALAIQAGGSQWFTDTAIAIQVAEPTLLDVVLPPLAQAQAVRLSLAQKLPTICQKPFAKDYAEACTLAQLADAQGTPLVVHENFRFSPWFRECKRLIDEGFFGRLHGMTFRLRPGDGQGPRAYLDRQPYFQTQEKLLVRETAIHMIDTFRFLMGEVQWAWAHLRKLNPVIAGEDSALLHFGFTDQRTATFDGNRLNEHPAQDQRRTMGEMWLEGERGVMRLDGAAKLWWKKHGETEAPHAFGGELPGPFGGAVQALQAHVISHLQHGTPLENLAHAYLANLAVEAAVYHSHATGARVDMHSFVP